MEAADQGTWEVPKQRRVNGGWKGVQTGALRLNAVVDMSAENVQGCQMFYLKCCWRHIFPNLALPHPIPTLSVLLTPPFTLTGLVTNGLGVEDHWYVG